MRAKRQNEEADSEVDRIIQKVSAGKRITNYEARWLVTRIGELTVAIWKLTQ